MENNVFVLALFISATLCSAPPSVTKQYRTDYVFNERTRAFYKFHSETRPGWEASTICQAEGAVLMAPVEEADIMQVHGMMKAYPDLGEHAYVASDGRDHESAEEPAIINFAIPEDNRNFNIPGFIGCNVVTRKGEIESLPCFHRLPFICKVEAKDAPYDRHCEVYANNYQYNETVGSCYSIPRQVGSWNKAYAECRAEGAHLVVLNSEAERAVVQALILNTPSVRGAQASWFFFAGFRANKPVGNETLVFKTIFNQTLEEAGFAEWAPNEPNNALGDEFCGTIFKNDGKLNDVTCDHLYAFICEKEVHQT